MLKHYEKCISCNKKCESLKLLEFERAVDSTPYHIRNNSVDYLRIYLFQCECGRIWFSLQYLPTHRFLDEVKIGELLKNPSGASE